MSFLPKDEMQPKKSGDNNRPSNTRIAIWVLAGGVGLYMIISGVVGILAK